MRDLHGARPDVEVASPDLPLRLVVQRGRATLVRDLVGQSLHRRGWRDAQHKSPLNEAIAAGLLLHTGWDRRSPLVDPMGGSGTFVVEAAHLATDRAPGVDLRPAALSWPGVDPAVWDRLVEEARDRHAAGRASCPPLLMADVHGGAVGLAERSIRAAGVEDLVAVRHTAVSALTLEHPPALVVANPPWGQRIGTEDHAASWRDLGTFLKTQCGGAVAWVLSGSPELTAAMRLKASRRHPVQVGPIDCRWIRYEIVGRGQGAPGEQPWWVG